MARGQLVARICVVLTGLLVLATAGIDTRAVAAGVPPEGLDEAADATGGDAVMSEPPVGLRIVDTRILAQITGRDSPNDTAARWDVYGADLGHMFWHRGKLHMVFGDTFGATGLLGRKNWRSNTMAVIADPDPRNGLPIETMITSPSGAAKELLPSRKVDGDEMTVIPTYGVSLDDRMYLHYMSVRHWGDPGHWDVGHSGLAYSDDDGRSWVVPAEAVWSANSGFEQVAFVFEEGMLYAFGIPEGRFGGVKLRRVAPAKILEPGAHEFWDGKQWVGEPARAATLVTAPVGELSVAWSEISKRWIMMYKDPEQRAVMLRTASGLTGPWSSAHMVTSADGLYAPYIVPGSEIGADLYYTLSRWEPYSVLLMHTTLEWNDVVALDAPGDGGAGGMDDAASVEPGQAPQTDRVTQ